MRSRRWILIIALFVAFTALVIYHGWNLFKVNERIKNYVLIKLKPALGGDCQIEKLEMALGAVHLKNVKINFKDNNFSLWVEDIRVGLNLTSVVKNGFHPQKIPHDILFIKPYLTIRFFPRIKSQNSASDFSVAGVSSGKYWEWFKNIDFIKRITISKGRISYADSINHHKVQLAHDVNGWLSSKNGGNVSARLVGKVLNSPNYNLLMTASIDVIRARLELFNIKLNNYKWQEKIPVFIPDHFNIRQGTIDGTISLANKKSSSNGFDIWGKVSLTDGSFQISNKNLYFDNININAEIKEWNRIVVESSSLLLNGSPFIISGNIKNLLDPRLELTLESKNFNIKENLDYMLPKSRINVRGYSNVAFQITSTFNNPTVKGQLSCSKLAIDNKVLHQFKSKFTFEASIFQIRGFSGQLGTLKLDGEGKIDFSRTEDNVSFSLNSSGEIFPELVKLPFRSLDSSASQLQIRGGGNLTHLSGTVDLRLKPLNQDTTFRFNGVFNIGEKQLSLRVISPSHYFIGEGSLFLSENQQKYLIKLKDVHNLLYGIPELQKLSKIFNYKTSFTHIEGDPANWRITGNYTWIGEKDEPNRTANMTCSIKSKDDTQHLSANINIYSGEEKFYSNLNLIRTPEYLEIKNFDIGNLFSSSGRIHLSDDNQIEASVILPNASLQKLESLIFCNNGLINQGKCYGAIAISGNLKYPLVSGKFDFSEVKLNKIGFYDAVMNFQLINNRVMLDEFNIKRNQQLIFNCDGFYSINNDQLNFDFTGKDIDLNSLVTTILNKPRLLEGKGSAEIKLRGSLKHPKLYGNVDVEHGKLSRFSYDQIILDLGDDQSLDWNHNAVDSDTLENGGVVFQRILITKFGQFQIEGRGVIPFSGEIPADIELDGKGNILSILPELTPFFVETKSKADWEVNLTGRPNNLIISGVKLTLSEGYLKLKDVAEEIKDIAAIMELEQDGFLNVKFIEGKIKGKKFTFHNFESVPISSDGNLESFLIPELGLNLGIFTLETSLKGIPLHIPGLMEKREIGLFIFSGKSEQEKFYFGGPLDQPLVRGKIQLQNANFTFPFIPVKSAPSRPDPVVEVLKKIEWNVTALVGKDLHYQRQIPSGLDNVYVDLLIDAGVGGLQFNGILDENSFGVLGRLESSRGMVEYLDLDFQVVKAGIEFDKSTLLPFIFGEARTTVTDSTGYPYYIYLTLLTLDEETGHAQKRGRFGEMAFQLSSDNPNLGDTEGEILASLGYSASNIPKMATDIIGISTDNLVFRPLFRPFERQLERTLGLDMVRFSSRFTRNLIEMNLSDERNFQFNSKLFLLRSTKLIIGKYLADRFFFLYTGQLEAGMDYRYQQEGFGFRHTLGLEYRINPGLLLQMEYDYNSLLLWQKDDKRIILRHSFPF